MVVIIAGLLGGYLNNRRAAWDEALLPPLTQTTDVVALGFLFFALAWLMSVSSMAIVWRAAAETVEEEHEAVAAAAAAGTKRSSSMDATSKKTQTI